MHERLNVCIEIKPNIFEGAKFSDALRQIQRLVRLTLTCLTGLIEHGANLRLIATARSRSCNRSCARCVIHQLQETLHIGRTFAILIYEIQQQQPVNCNGFSFFTPTFVIVDRGFCGTANCQHGKTSVCNSACTCSFYVIPIAQF